MLRRKTMPERLVPAWEAFLAQAERVEAARQALLRCLPVGRGEVGPIPVALALLRDELVAVRAELGAWRVPEIERSWTACARAVDAVLADIGTAQEIAERTDELEDVLHVIGEIVDQLDEWAEAERAWLGLRTRR